ncbi:tRNA (adenosine(37)-N6)-threonylcarbamoyltransferase complex dimerization subunit type 1 TsaB [Buchnera aphidicola]|uniref:tRNA (adenosine(37)-N6)-threonylcarbamoyltransferase complex dimerization subunit type 1 TsaB n=1 Tax=Buchnera aphidicola TaxID=9 RepID=UPI0010771428|nr:tRNA (adenosine(37)-N6)-threonylcarbamoyltransferase complex dimerization subunit type 1 TsaB [Buchnera aphidicola]VFP79220.1 tRNA threonylcarbamoyladenosine biosynthesis protein TsaB [Buchnera aphidicola (Cinara curtihirsuta)]
MNFTKTILALDTTLYSCSVSLLHKKKIYSLFKSSFKNHEIYILNMIKTILKKANTTLRKIDFIACTIGPGSFTGIRISIGISQTISIIYKIPIIGFSTLQILSEQSWNINKINRVLIAVQISKNQIFWAKYLKNKIGLWVGIHTEKLYNNINNIKKITKNYKGIWSTIGFKIKINYFKKSTKLFNTHITTPHSKDIISCSIKHLQHNKKYKIMQIYPRYLSPIY